MKLELTRETASPGTPERQRLDELCADLERALAGLRELAHTIFPASLADHGLTAALRSAATRSRLDVRIEDGLAGRRYPPELEAAVYFSCVEVLHAAEQHGAHEAGVTICLDDGADELVFSIRHEGGTPDPAALTTMRDRLAAFGGVVADESAEGRGSAVTCSVPAAPGAVD